MITKNELFNEFETATNAFLSIITALDQEDINIAPFDGSWTAAQVTEHLYKSDNGILKAVYGPVQETSRPPDENVGQLQGIFLDFTTKLKSPDHIIPSDVKHNKESLIADFKSRRSQLGEAIKTLDLSPTCYAPIFGEPTRLELFSFVIYHTRRHTHQVKNIFEKLVHS